MNDIKELKDEELEKVSGGIIFVAPPEYKRDPDGTFNNGDIVVEDFTGIRYIIEYFSSFEHDSKGDTNWYFARVVYVPDSQKGSVSEDSTKYVNSSFVQLYK